MNGDERERMLPPPTATPTRRPDAPPRRAPVRKDTPRREAGPGHDIAAVRIQPDDARQWSKTLDRFPHNGARLTADHRKAIEALAAEIAARLAMAPGARADIAISGHTDTSGDETANETLGLARADAAKTALEAALGRKKVGADRIARTATETLGESRLAVKTGNDVKEAANRRVEITVCIEAPPPSAATPPPAPTPAPQAEAPPRKPIDWNLPRGYKVPEEDWWTRTERELEPAREYDRTHPPRSRSVTDVIADAVTQALEPVIRKLPKAWREKARSAIRKGVESGTEKGCEAAIDASPLKGEDAEAAKAACKAALKTKPGGAR